MNKTPTLETMKLLGLNKDDKFTLKHHVNENQNKYSDIVFTYNGKKIEPEVNLFQICAGIYIINKVE